MTTTNNTSNATVAQNPNANPAAYDDIQSQLEQLDGRTKEARELKAMLSSSQTEIEHSDVKKLDGRSKEARALKAKGETKVTGEKLDGRTKEARALKSKDSTSTPNNTIEVSTIERTSGRNFYAVKPNRSGNDTPYAFERVNDRNNWMQKHADAKSISAMEVYIMMQKQSDDVLIANRNNRVVKLKGDDVIEPKKGQRLLVK